MPIPFGCISGPAQSADGRGYAGGPWHPRLSPNGEALGGERSAGRLGDKWHLDEAIITIAGKKHWLWRAVDQDGFVLDVLVQSRRNARAAKRLMRKLLKSQGHPPRAMITDKLRSYCRWLTERARRSRRTATRVSPAPISQTSFARAGRAREAPEPCSCTIGAQPAARSLISYASVACTSVETRA